MQRNLISKHRNAGLVTQFTEFQCLHKSVSGVASSILLPSGCRDDQVWKDSLVSISVTTNIRSHLPSLGQDRLVLFTVQPAYKEMLVAIPHIELVKGLPAALEQDSYFRCEQRELNRVWSSDDWRQQRQANCGPLYSWFLSSQSKRYFLPELLSYEMMCLTKSGGPLFSKHNKPSDLSSWSKESSPPTYGVLATLITFNYSLFFASLELVFWINYIVTAHFIDETNFTRSYSSSNRIKTTIHHYSHSVEFTVFQCQIVFTSSRPSRSFKMWIRLPNR